MSNYNLTQFQSNVSTSFVQYFEFANQATSGFFGIMMIISLYIILFVSTKQFGNRQAVAASGFITLIIAMLSRAAGIIPDVALYVSFALAAVSAVYMYNSQ